MNVTCKSCGHEFFVADEKAGKLVRCGNCRKFILVPRSVPAGGTAKPDGEIGPPDGDAAAHDVATALAIPVAAEAEETDSTVDPSETKPEPAVPESDTPTPPDGKRHCASCGAELPDGAKFCGDCGAKAPEETKFCTNCGTKLPGSARFCPGCGASTDEGAVAPAPVAVPGPAMGLAPAQPAGQGEYVPSGRMSFSGRATRSEYFLTNCLAIPLLGLLLVGLNWMGISAVGVDFADEGLRGLGVFLVVDLVAVVFLVLLGLATQVRRLHDVGWAGMCVLLPLIPFVGWIAGWVLCVVLLFMDGQPGPNRYGPDPKRRPSPFVPGTISGTIRFSAGG